MLFRSPARALPYELNVVGDVDFAARTVTIQFVNSGQAAAVFQVRSGSQEGPWTYTVGSVAQALDTWIRKAKSVYDLSVYGPNGFFRSLKGTIGVSGKANLGVRSTYDAEPGITLEIVNRGASTSGVRIFDAYSKQTVAQSLASGQTLVWHWSLTSSSGWYDLAITVDSDSTFKQQLAGHVETGANSTSDPLLGA